MGWLFRLLVLVIGLSGRSNDPRVNDAHNVSAALGSIKESFGRVVYSHKTHEKAAARLNRNLNWVKRLNLALLVLTFSGVLNALLSGGFGLNLATTVVSGAALGLAIYQMSFNPSQGILEHRNTANKLWKLREDFTNLIGDIHDGALSHSEVRKQRDALTKRLGEIYDDSPQTTSKDYEKAQKSLNPGEEMTFSKGEVERFLPSALRDASNQDLHSRSEQQSADR